jgi:erythromycin esterase-like protein
MEHLRLNMLSLWLPLRVILFFCTATQAQTIFPLGSFSLDSTAAWLENAFDNKIPDNIQVIGLGEVTHGGHEIPQVKAKTFQFLVEKKGFRTLLFEYPNAALSLLNLYLEDNKSTSDNILREIATYEFSNSLFDKALLDLLVWIKHYNLSHPNDLIALRGVDINGASGSFSNYFEHNFSSLLDTITRKRIDSEWNTTSIDTITTQLIEWQNNHKDSVQARLKSYYADFLYNVKNAEVDIANRILAKTNFYKSLYIRDSMMAKNVEELRTGKAVFWAHNSHVSSADMVSAGNILKKDLGGQYYVIATDFSEKAAIFIMAGTGIMEKTFLPDKKTLSSQLLQKIKISQGIVFYDDLPKKMTPVISSVSAFGDRQIFERGKPFDALIILKTISPTLSIH